MATQKTLKKKFFEVKLPLTAAKVFLYGTSIEQFNNNVVKIDLTKNLKGKSLELRAKVMHENGALTGDPISLELIKSYIRRMIRKGSDYVEDSFELTCKDAVLLVKPFLLTRKKVSRAVRNELRIATRKYLEAHMTIRTAHEVFSDMMTNKLQKELFLKLKKIYPLSLCEIRIVEILSRHSSPSATSPAPSAHVEPEAPTPRKRRASKETTE